VKRRELLKMLEEYHPTDPQEQGYKKEIVSFIERNTECFERSFTIGHITASSLLLNAKGTKALLMHHTKLDQWFQLGGHCDGNPDVRAVALKEAQEESGIEEMSLVSPDIFDVDIHWIPDNPKEAGHFHYDIRFLLRLETKKPIVQNSESKELRWIGKYEELPTTNKSVVRLFSKWRNL